MKKVAVIICSLLSLLVLVMSSIAMVMAARWSTTVTQLETYVDYAGKLKAELDWAKGRTFYLSPAGAAGSGLPTNETYPVYTKWDRRFVDQYNERKRELLEVSELEGQARVNDEPGFSDQP